MVKFVVKLMNIVTGLISVFLILMSCPAQAENRVLSVEIEKGKTEVTILDGKATLFKKGITKVQSLSKGDFLSEGDRVTTGKKSRMELKLPDKSFIRFDEHTTFELKSIDFDKKRKERNIKVNMVLGKTWANVSKLFGGKRRFAILTKMAVAGVRGTVYRLNVEEDNSVLIKVYIGEVVAGNSPKTSFVVRPEKVMKPSKIAGPHSVSGPHPVSIEEWTYIVMSMQQISIYPDGRITKPVSFTATDENLNDWVCWNRSLDKKVTENTPRLIH